MAKELDLSNTVHTLCTTYPELVSILQELGFADIAKPGMLQTAGRFMTLKKGAAMKKIDIEKITETLTKHGFRVLE